ncbi:Parvulin-like peptidyl-prolyl isomerase [Amphibacillus marinus]|uniref:peptidylprolyl isomerase n=1 Tax=Amphibacillus marinus TaxID=872970 RepID=A0A1H8TKB7_9BACI|nr:peptidyl-prolyl cis-trans isomerase [Amphibacillus marinus]SEO91271.1 Parvulin-like peptidyl-prolyl isomerase [Amphibacillus marinus]
MNIKKFLLVFILALMLTNVVTLFLLNRANNNQADYESIEEIDVNSPVAVINGEEIFYNEWMQYLEVRYGELGLEELIDRQVVSQLAEQEGLSVQPGVIDYELAMLATLAGQLPEQKVEQIEANWRRDIEHQILTDMLLSSDISITDEEVGAYYDRYQSEYEFSQRIELSHIVVDDQATADRVYGELENGAAFSALAREYTIDEDSSDHGGYLGFFTSTSSFLPEGYFDRALDLDEFSYTEPFSTYQGYVIVYLHRELPSIQLGFNELETYIRVKLAMEQVGDRASVKPLWQELNVDWIY